MTDSTAQRPGVLFVNFGGPQSAEALEPFLANLLSDVLPLPPWLARLAGTRLAARRAPKVLPNYEAIGWSPLVPETLAQAEAAMAGVTAKGLTDVPFETGMMFSEPSIPSAIERLATQGVDALVVVGLFPHYSFATAGSAYQMVHEALVAADRADWPVHYRKPFFDTPRYLSAVADTIRQTLQTLGGDGSAHVLFSAHGIPVSFVRKADPYPTQVEATCRGAAQLLGPGITWSLAWQSRLGPVRWLTPDTPTEITRLAQAGTQRIVVVPVSFVGEHIETLDELDREYVPEAREQGIAHVGRAPAVGLHPEFIGCLTDEAYDGLTAFTRYSCMRCAIPKPDAHRRQATCPNCRFSFPGFLRDGRTRR